ncbi:MAG: hypothetical protein R3178_06670, partial [Rhodothermales bacterium]|nr:hypothetical protein [Rhodothermales bacterium]
MFDRLPRRHDALTLALAALCALAPAAARTASAAEPDSVKYWIRFTDKGPGDVSESHASDHLSQRALERRRTRGASWSSTTDLPVFESYINQIRELAIQEVVTSRWLNGISAYVPEQLLPQVRALPFVREVRPVGVAVAEAIPQALDLTDHAAAPVVVSDGTSAEYGSSETQLSIVNAIQPLEQGFNGTGVRLGFLDTTYDGFNHPVFGRLRSEGRLIEVRNFTGAFQTNLHGRAVASIAAGYLEGQLIGPGHGA